MDARAGAEAARLGISKSALIRRGLAAVLGQEDSTGGKDDPWRKLAGFADRGAGTTPGEIDDVVYGT